MQKKVMMTAALAVALLSGCASVSMESPEKNQQLKAFPTPPQDQSGLYIFRDSMLGASLKKTVSVDGQVIGETAPKTYFYRLLTPGQHVLSTESEFGDNSLDLTTEGGKNYYVRQYIKMGVLAGGANLEQVSEADGKKGVEGTNLAR